MIEHLGIEFLEVSQGFIKASMPVDQRTTQPYGWLHGGASVALAETLGSIAAQIQIGPHRRCAGVEINANHLQRAESGEVVYGIARPVRIGSSIQVWEIKITNHQEDLICISRITVVVMDKK